MPRDIRSNAESAARHRARGLLLGLALAASLAGFAPARGQGTNGTFPDPVAARDLDGYARRLGLSEQQRLAVDRHHEAYLDAFRALREGEIQRYLDETGGVMRRLMTTPDAREVRRGLNELNRLSARIRYYDEQLFDEMQTVLSEDQRVGMPAVRQLRERARHRAGAAGLVISSNIGARVELGTIIDAIDLPPADRAVLAPVLREYERRLTVATGKLQDEAQAMLLRIVKALEAMANEGDGSPRGQWRRMREVWKMAGEDAMETTAAISQLNLWESRLFASMISVDAARRLRDAFRERVYPDVHGGIERGLDRFDAALRLPDLGETRTEAITAARDTLVMRQEQLAETMVDTTEVLRREALTRRFGRAGQSAAQTKLAELRKRRDALNAEALAALEALLGRELFATLNRPASPGSDLGAAAGGAAPMPPPPVERVEPPAPGERSGRAAASREPVSRAVTSDRFLPEPITVAELGRYRDRLGLGDQEAVIGVLYDGYLDAWATHAVPVVEAAKALWALDAETGRIAAPEETEIDRLFERRREAFDAVRALDGSFLNDVAVLIPPEAPGATAAMDGVRRERERLVYNRGEAGGVTAPPRGSRMPGATAGRETSLDLAMLCAEHLPDELGRSPVAEALAGYEPEIVALWRERLELWRDLARTAEHRRARMRRSRTAGVPESSRRTAGSDPQDEARDRELAIARSITELNRHTLETIASALPEPSAAALRSAYRRAAHPQVYANASAMEGSFRAALALDDLTPGQRGRIGELFAEYRVAYRRLCDNMIELSTAVDDERDAPSRWRRQVEQRNQREKLAFERREMNDKARRQLRAVLDEAQADRLGLPAEG